jgi:hypothetical protein
VTLVLDAGAFVAVERGDRRIVALIKKERLGGRPPVTHGGVVGQVWRGGSRQVALARVLPGVEVVPLDERLGRRAGVLLGRSSRHDVIDAAVVLLAAPDDVIMTSDPDDIAVLAAAVGTPVRLLEV